MTNVIEGDIILPTQTVRGQVTYEAGMITAVQLDQTLFVSPSIRMDDDEYLAPGFVDIQINRTFGKEFRKQTSDALSYTRERVVRYGTTAFCPTITSMETINPTNISMPYAHLLVAMMEHVFSASI